MKKILILSPFALMFFACGDFQTTDSGDGNNFPYFNKDELSDDIYTDSMMNYHYSNDLRSMNEYPLKDTTNQNMTVRLTVTRHIYNTYCIRVDKTDSTTIVAYKLLSDPLDFRRTGLNWFELNYESNFSTMDSIWNNLAHEIEALEIFDQDNSIPERAKLAIPADGTDFLLEYYANGKHKVIERWSGFLRDGFYYKNQEFLNIIKQMHALVPDCLFPDINEAEKLEDLRFPIFRKNSKSANKLFGVDKLFDTKLDD